MTQAYLPMANPDEFRFWMWVDARPRLEKFIRRGLAAGEALDDFAVITIDIDDEHPQWGVLREFCARMIPNAEQSWADSRASGQRPAATGRWPRTLLRTFLKLAPAAVLVEVPGVVPAAVCGAGGVTIFYLGVRGGEILEWVPG